MYGTRFGLSFLVALMATMMLAPPTQAEPTKCKAAILKNAAAFVQAKAKALQKCEDGRVKGKILVPCPDQKAQDAINKAQGKLADGIAKACGGSDKLCGNSSEGEDSLDTIGWDVGSCPNFNNDGCNNDILSCAGISLCVGCIGGSAVDQAIDLYYGSLNPSDPKLEKALNKCQQAIGKASTSFLLAQSKALQKCWDGVNKGKINDCPDVKTGDTITNAAFKAKSTIAKGCGGKDKAYGGTGENADILPTDIGFPANCLDVTFPGAIVPCSGAINTVEDLANCALCVTRFDSGCADRGAALPFAIYPADCNPGPVVTPTPTATATPTPTATSTPSALCGNGVLNPGEQCDPTSGTPNCPNVNNALYPCNANCTCDCPSIVSFLADASDPDSILDTGWTGISHDATIVSGGKISVTVSNCAGNGRPCGVCDLGGPVNNLDAGAGGLDDQRCSGNTSIKCNTNADCTGFGTCEIFFGSLLPLSAGGVSTCVENRVVGSLTGTANIETGASTATLNLNSRVWLGAAPAGIDSIDHPCPRCLGDSTPNDGNAQGTCSGGARDGLACDANGSHALGTTSLDCPMALNGANAIANLPVPLSSTTGTATRTLSAANPNCRAQGYTTNKCFCDSCNNAAATPCSTNADCVAVGATVCGGKRCVGGTNNGAACAANSECAGGGFCQVPGSATAPNACAPPDGAPDGCVPGIGTDEGECADGPLDQNCAAPEQHRGCTIPTQAADCPITGNCVPKNRECFLDNGLIGGQLGATGAPDTPVNDVSHPKMATTFCIGFTGSSSVNGTAGLPGPGRLTLKGTATGVQ